ncbi:MAG TPA: YraN family protein [Longimicrobiales bacterium]|nr:YraN family protein [Longimicrobiales bacterium]
MENRSDHAPHALGRWGEARAARFLEARGWTVLARNYRFGRREVDLVVRRADLVVFVEVKTRAGALYGAPLEAVTRLKRREIEAVAAHFLRHHGLDGAQVRFDALGIVVRREGPRPTVEIEHVADAWRPGWP